MRLTSLTGSQTSEPKAPGEIARTGSLDFVTVNNQKSSTYNLFRPCTSVSARASGYPAFSALWWS